MNEDPTNEAENAGAATNPVSPRVANVTLPTMQLALGAGATGRLGAREEATASELAQLDPQLASLFRFGHEASRSSDPAVVYMIAHAGRELGRGVVRALADPGVSVTTLTEDAIPNDDERNRITIAGVLQLQPNHPTVKVWFQLIRIFADSAHYTNQPPSLQRVRSAFAEFSDLLFGRVAPYFATHTELEQLMLVERPRADDVARVRTLLTRHTQRQHFFSRLQHDGWFEALAELQYFDTPPNIVRDEEGRELPQAWPEGQYLASVAATRPEQVALILRNIPKSMRNPVVWRTVADAALVMPSEQACTLVPGLIHGLANSGQPQFFAHLLVKLVASLARAGEPIAFELAEALLWMAARPTHQDANPKEAGELMWARRGRRETEWILERISLYELQQLCKDAVPVLAALDDVRTLKLLASRLDRAVFLATGAGSGEGVLGSSRWWCETLDAHSHADDVRAHLAVATNATALTAATPAAAAARVWNVLKEYRSDIFDRIRLNVLTVAGEWLRNELDTVIGSDGLLDPPYGAREVAVLLRTQFNYASPEAKRVFRYALERGPRTEAILVALQRRGSWEGSGESTETADTPAQSDAMSNVSHAGAEVVKLEEVVRSLTEGWQRRRLRWFHDKLPPELAALAERLNVTPAVPSAQAQALDEVDVYSQGARWVDDRSPMDADALGSMGDEDLVDFLVTWKEGPDRFDGPNERGLARAVHDFAKQHPGRVVEVAKRAYENTVPDIYLTALIQGAGDADVEGWLEATAYRRLSDFGATLVANSPRTDIPEERVEGQGTDGQLPDRRQSLRAIITLLERVCVKNGIGESDSDSVWAFVNAVIRTPSTWSETTEENVSTFGAVSMAALSTLGGDVTDLLVEVALADYRRLSGRATDGRVVPEVERRIVPLLEHVIKQTGPVALGAELLIGQYTPQLLLVAPEWMSSHLHGLFDDGAIEPHRRPAWGGYITRSDLYENAFKKLRPWYVHAADAAADSAPDGVGARSMGESLGLHVIAATVHGWCSVGDSDGLVERTFNNLRVEHRAHSYWFVFRWWSDATTSPLPEQVTRLMALWDWRIGVLEVTAPAADVAEEAEGLVWLLATPHVPAADAIRLGTRTLDLLELHRRTTDTMWKRVSEIAREVPAASFSLTERLLRNAFRAPYAYLPFEEVAPALRAALACEDPLVRERATRSVHDLGARGFSEFGVLLTEERQSAASTVTNVPPSETPDAPATSS